MDGKAIREPKCLKRNFMRKKRLTESRRRMETELGVRFRRRVSVNEQGPRQQRLRFSWSKGLSRPRNICPVKRARIHANLIRDYFRKTGAMPTCRYRSGLDERFGDIASTSICRSALR